jgi:hypothetical protein
VGGGLPDTCGCVRDRKIPKATRRNEQKSRQVGVHRSGQAAGRLIAYACVGGISAIWFGPEWKGSRDQWPVSGSCRFLQPESVRSGRAKLAVNIRPPLPGIDRTRPPGPHVNGVYAVGTNALMCSCHLAVSEARLALADFDKITIRIAKVAADLAVLFLWLRDKLSSSTSP